MVTPTWEIETQYWEQGIAPVAGIDEAGMGALAGPVIAAAIIWDQQFSSHNFQFSNFSIRDSKTLSAKQREAASEWIQEQAVAWAVGQASAQEIDTLNIRQAAILAMRRAIEQLTEQPVLLLIDGNPIQIHDSLPAVNIIKGDSLSYSIAAASILAKVYRDNLMVKLHGEYPVYNFASHKGYGSKGHLEALREHGPCAWHRKSYAPVRALLTSPSK